MKAFLWYEIGVVSDRYHSGGSVLIEAETLERAREIALNGETKMKVEKEPDAIFDSTSKTEKLWVFPDAGCC